MLSVILLDNEPHPATLADLHHVTRLEGVVAGCQLTIDPDSALFDEPPRLAVRPDEATYHHSLDQPQWEAGPTLRDLLRRLAAAEPPVEILLRPPGLLLPVQAPHQGAGQGRLGVARPQRERPLDLVGADARDQPEVLLGQGV